MGERGRGEEARGIRRESSRHPGERAEGHTVTTLVVPYQLTHMTFDFDRGTLVCVRACLSICFFRLFSYANQQYLAHRSLPSVILLSSSGSPPLLYRPPSPVVPFSCFLPLVHTHIPLSSFSISSLSLPASATGPLSSLSHHTSLPGCPMAPKAKKPSKAELAAEAERLAEEQRIADEIEAKRQEELRIEREAHEAVEAEQRRAAEEEHIARVAAELEIHGPSYASEAAELRKERAAFEADKLWNRYITDTVLPDPTDQPGVRSYLYAWETSPTSSDLEKAFDELQEAATLRTNLVTESMLAQEQVRKACLHDASLCCTIKLLSPRTLLCWYALDLEVGRPGDAESIHPQCGSVFTLP